MEELVIKQQVPMVQLLSKLRAARDVDRARNRAKGIKDKVASKVEDTDRVRNSVAEDDEGYVYKPKIYIWT